MRFLLASSSPRRRELFALLGLTFDIVMANVDETPRDGEPADQMVVRLAQSKAVTVADACRSPDPCIIVAADTVVALGGVSLGKPKDDADAWRMLLALRGRTHQVYTAVTLLDTHTGRRLSDLATTQVPMRNYGDDEIAAYIASGDPLDKAGAYAIQHEGFHPVAHMHGCFANVMGLPLCHLTRTLRTLGFRPPTDVPATCQLHLRYACPVFGEILGAADRR